MNLRVLLGLVTPIRVPTMHLLLNVFLIIQVIDEYDEESEVAERLRIRVLFSSVFRCFSFDSNLVCHRGFVNRCRQCHFFTSTRTGSSWKRSRPGTRRGSTKPSSSTPLPLLRIPEEIGVIHQRLLNLWTWEPSVYGFNPLLSTDVRSSIVW